MGDEEEAELEMVVSGPEGTTLRELAGLRSELYNDLVVQLNDSRLGIHQEAASRSLDPAVVGAIALVILPIFVEKVADILINWGERHTDCHVTIKVPIDGADPIEIAYDAATPSDKIKSAIRSALEALKESKRG